MKPDSDGGRQPDRKNVVHRPMGYTIIAHRYISKTNTQSTQAGTAARQKRRAEKEKSRMGVEVVPTTFN
jgi:hypothetical protein